LCETCINNTSCTTCAALQAFAPNTAVDVAKCATADATTCHADCLTCTDVTATTCTLCATNLYKKTDASDNACYVNTTAGFYVNTTVTPKILTACTTGCATCINDTSCTTCNTDYYFKDGTVFDVAMCLINTTAGHYLDTTSSTLKTCDASCATCINDTTCTTCISTKFLKVANNKDITLCTETTDPTKSSTSSTTTSSTRFAVYIAAFIMILAMMI